jgi:hypothetical protein
MNRRQFKDFLSDMESEYGDALYYTEVRWLSRGRMLKRVYVLKSETELFLEMKVKPLPQLLDNDWMCDFAFCMDITQHMNEMNIKLQGANNLPNDIFDKIKELKRSFDCGNWSCHEL